MKQKPSTKPSETDWERLKTMTDDEIDTSDIPEVTPEQFARAVVMKGLEPIPSKKLVSLRIDQDVLEWFRAQGSGYQTRMNQLLRAYMEAHQK